MIEIKLLNKVRLANFISSEEYSSLENIPISKHRAVSHINNPKVADNDILLLLAYFDDKMVGYLGVMPEHLFFNNKKIKSGLLTSLWVNPKFRGNQIGLKLILKSHELYHKNILLADYVEHTIKIYNKTNNFKSPILKTGVRLYIKSDLQTILPPKKIFFKKIKNLLSIFDFVINLFIKFIYLFFRTKINSNIEYVSFIDEEINEFIKPKLVNEVFQRQKEELNWVIEYPWVLSSPKIDDFNKRFYFSSIDNSFEYFSIKIKNKKNKITAFLILTKRNNTLKMPYCYYEKNSELEVVNVINEQLLKLKICTFTCFHKDISKLLLENKTISLYKKKIVRKYLISKNLPFNETNFNIQDGDGDCAFT